MRALAQLIIAATGSTSVVEAAGVPDPEEGRTIRYRIDRLRDRLGFEPAISLSAGIATWADLRREELARGVAP
jgi:nucleoside-diphosphate-sugar epimerase